MERFSQFNFLPPPKMPSLDIQRGWKSLGERSEPIRSPNGATRSSELRLRDPLRRSGDSRQKCRSIVSYKLLERNRRAAEQTGNGVGDGCGRAAGEVAEQFGHGADVPFGHS